MTDVKPGTLPCPLSTKQDVFPASAPTFQLSVHRLLPPPPSSPLSSTTLQMGWSLLSIHLVTDILS